MLNDRTQSATSLEDGMAEFMIQRRMYKDDSRGVGECLNETDDVQSTRGMKTNMRHYWRLIPENYEGKND